MTDKEVEDIIRSNMNLQMNLAGIRADFEEKLQRTWFGLTLDERIELAQDVDWAVGAYCEYAEKIEIKLKEKNEFC